MQNVNTWFGCKLTKVDTNTRRQWGGAPLFPRRGNEESGGMGGEEETRITIWVCNLTLHHKYSLEEREID